MKNNGSPRRSGPRAASTMGTLDPVVGTNEGIFRLMWIYLMFEFVRPQDIIGIPAFSIPFLASTALVIYWLGRGDKSILKDPLIRAYMFFIGAMILSVVAVRNHYYWMHDTRAVAWYLVAVVLPCATFLATPAQVSRLLKSFAVFNAITAVYVIAHEGVGQGGPLTDENDVALAMVMALPYAWFLAQSPRNTGFQKTVFLIAAAIIMAAVVATKSRGGFLGLAAVVISLFLLSPNKGRNFILAVTLGVAVLASAPKEFWDRMSTLTQSESGSGEERLYHWGRGVDMFLDYPILGVGVGNYAWRMAEYQLKDQQRSRRQGPLLGGRQAHSVYISVLSELGIVGTLLFLWMIRRIFRKLREALDFLHPHLDVPVAKEMYLLARSIQISFLGFLVSGTFISVLYYVHFWYVIGFALTLERAVALLRTEQTGWSKKSKTRKSDPDIEPALVPGS